MRGWVLCVVLMIGALGAGPAMAEEPAGIEQQAQLVLDGQRLEREGDHEGAAKRYDEIVKKYPTHAEARAAALGAVRAWGAAGDTKQQERAASVVQKLYGAGDIAAALEAWVMIGDHHWLARRPDPKRAAQWYTRAVSVAAKQSVAPASPAGHLASKAAFMLIEEDYEAWRAAPAPQDVKQLPAQLKAHVEAATKLGARYAAVSPDKNCEWRWAAMYRVGRIYEDLAMWLRATGNPFPTADEAHGAYAQSLASHAAPMEQKALEVYRQLIAGAREASVSNGWTRQAAAAEASLVARGVTAAPAASP